MGGLDYPELSLDLSNEHKPKTVSGLLQEVEKMRDSCKKISKVENYVAKLEDEMKKIDAFRRELPLCMLLLNDAIERLKEEVIKCKEDRDEVEEIVMAKGGKANPENDKKNWMSSVQLWNTDSSDHDLSSELKLGSDGEEYNCVSASKKCKSGSRGGGFMSINLPGSEPKKMKRNKDIVVPVSSLSLMPPVVQLGYKDVGLMKSNCLNVAGEAFDSSLFTDQIQSQSKIENSKQLHHQQQQQLMGRKQRRCWSAELHRRFVDALRQLGGSQVATPKQIREIMQVDGLTNDEVKSHLQKYRLHVRKIPTSGTDNGLIMSQDDLPTKVNNHQSSSPKGPLQTSASGKGMSTTYGDSMEEVEDEEFEGNSWKERIHN